MKIRNRKTGEIAFIDERSTYDDDYYEAVKPGRDYRFGDRVVFTLEPDVREIKTPLRGRTGSIYGHAAFPGFLFVEVDGLKDRLCVSEDVISMIDSKPLAAQEGWINSTAEANDSMSECAELTRINHEQGELIDELRLKLSTAVNINSKLGAAARGLAAVIDQLLDPVEPSPF